MKSILPIALAAATLLAPAATPALAETVAPDPEARQVTALGGTLVWVSREGPGQALMRRSPDGVIAPVAGSGDAAFYRSPDLGRNSQGALVLTYARCVTSVTRCTYVRDDLNGNRSRLRGLALDRCAVSSTPAIWGRRIAYGLSCFKREDGRRVSDVKRTGLYVKTGSRAPRRLPTPRNARRAGARDVSDVDLRGKQVAAVYADIWAFAVIQTTSGRDRFSGRAASSEGDGEQGVSGVIVGTGEARMWFLTRSFHAGDPAQSIINRRRTDCSDWQVLTAAAGPEGELDFPYIDLAVDDGALYAVDPGVGIVTHAYQPQVGC